MRSFTIDNLFCFLRKLNIKCLLQDKKPNVKLYYIYGRNNGVRKANEINNRTNIPLSTIYDNIKKLKTTSNLDHARGNGRKKKLLRKLQKLWVNIYAEIHQFRLEHWRQNYQLTMYKYPTRLFLDICMKKGIKNLCQRLHNVDCCS